MGNDVSSPMRVREWMSSGSFKQYMLDYVEFFKTPQGEKAAQSLKVPSVFEAWASAANRTEQLTGAFSFSLAKDGQGLPLHAHGDAWNQLLVGKKLWTLYKPSLMPRGGANPGLSHKKWLAKFRSKDWSNIEAHHKTGPNWNGYSVLQEAGDVLYIPEGWLHGAVSIGETVAVGQQMLSTYGTPFNKLMRAQLALADENVTHALELVHEAAEANPRDFYALIMLAEVAPAAGEWDQIPNVLDDLININPEHPMSHMIRVELFSQEGWEGDVLSMASDSIAKLNELYAGEEEGSPRLANVAQLTELLKEQTARNDHGAKQSVSQNTNAQQDLDIPSESESIEDRPGMNMMEEAKSMGDESKNTLEGTEGEGGHKKPVNEADGQMNEQLSTAQAAAQSALEKAEQKKRTADAAVAAAEEEAEKEMQRVLEDAMRKKRAAQEAAARVAAEAAADVERARAEIESKKRDGKAAASINVADASGDAQRVRGAEAAAAYVASARARSEAVEEMRHARKAEVAVRDTWHAALHGHMLRRMDGSLSCAAAAAAALHVELHATLLQNTMAAYVRGN